MKDTVPLHPTYRIAVVGARKRAHPIPVSVDSLTKKSQDVYQRAKDTFAIFARQGNGECIILGINRGNTNHLRSIDEVTRKLGSVPVERMKQHPIYISSPFVSSLSRSIYECIASPEGRVAFDNTVITQQANFLEGITLEKLRNFRLWEDDIVTAINARPGIYIMDSLHACSPFVQNRLEVGYVVLMPYESREVEPPQVKSGRPQLQEVGERK
ncbi:TPA: hypothetical protein HA278_07865 [Candidatus Woesearchaeota archaeon]|jgi:hypothetical protein|nr:hypothetical protein [archaeon]HIJ11948.1 hypothetical protein [Candidatus Woesearchaeota archaeon]|tara:strand:- start:34 stop:672 length:639 start_codon:yes stop_codon:yes gene_type:complete